MAPGNRKTPRNAQTSASQYMLTEFMADFPDDEACLVWLWNTRYAIDGGDTAFCERCEMVRVFKRYTAKQQRQDWTCTGCGLHVHPTAGTIFHKSSTSLQLWFYAMYLMTSTRSGISAKQLERELGVTYKTAYRIFKQIRTQLMVQDDDEPLSGTVEMDEMYVGGKPRLADKAAWANGTYTEKKVAAKTWANEKRVPVFGMVERGGNVRAIVVPSTRTETLMPHIADNVKRGSTVYTDEAKMYNSLPLAGFEHQSVRHVAQVYVSGDVHTQTIEGFWSLVKRGIWGVHHSVSRQHLQMYLNEYVWRFNRRNDGRMMFASLILRSSVPIK
jgi:transposase-like protein